MISVVIPVYNGEKWIENCIEALQSQTIFDQLEIIFVNDGSTDCSGKVIEEFAGKIENIRVIHTENYGVSHARNTGIDNATGQYIAFMDVDDSIEPDFYETLQDNMGEGCDIVCAGYIVEYPTEKVSHHAGSKCHLKRSAAMKAYLLSDDLDPNIWDKLFRRELVKDLRFDTGLVRSEDRYFVFQCIKNARSIEIIPSAKYHYMMNEGSAMHSEFNRKKLDSCIVAENITREIRESFPAYLGLAESNAIDIKCRIYGDIYRSGKRTEFSKEYDQLKKDIKNFSIRRKCRFSSRKHTLALIAAKIHPALYVFIKYGMKFQFRKGLMSS